MRPIGLIKISNFLNKPFFQNVVVSKEFFSKLQQSLLSFRALGLTEKFMHNHESFFKQNFLKYVKYVKIFLVGHFWHFFNFKQKYNIAFFSKHDNAGLKTFFNIFLNASS